METPSRPKKQNIGVLGAILIGGGALVLRETRVTQVFYGNLGAQGSVSWAHILGWAIIIAGAALLLGRIISKD